MPSGGTQSGKLDMNLVHAYADKVNDDLRKLYGLSPYNTSDNKLYGNIEFATLIEERYGLRPDQLRILAQI